MHVKYASRHALYPVPNVIDSATVMVAARALLRAGVRDAVRAADVRAGAAALRAVVVVVAARAVVARDMFVLLLPREFVAVREMVFLPVRAVVPRWVVVAVRALD